jgi:hypothetical protein
MGNIFFLIWWKGQISQIRLHFLQTISRIFILLRAQVLFLISATYAKVLEVISLKLLGQVLEAILDLTLHVNPLFAALTFYPVLTISVGILTVFQVDLAAEVTVLIILVGWWTRLAQPIELALTRLSTGPFLVVVAKWLEAAEFISASSKTPFCD